jgi:ATP-dependent helicase/DNAse subunit B
VLPEIPLQLSTNEFSVKIRGSIDRLDVGKDFYRVTDYKRRTLPTHAELQRGDVPQLLLYAMALAQLPAPWGESFALARARLGYWSFLQGKAGGKVAKLELACGRMKERWQERVQTLLYEGAAFAPEPGTHCQFCVYDGICRKDEVISPP